MEDAAIVQQRQPQQEEQQRRAGQQQQGQEEEEVIAAEASGSSAWGTLEELFLVSAVSRHGTGDWSVVSGELQSRVKLLALPSTCFSSEACESKFDALNGRYGGSGYCNGGNGREQHPPWFEDIRKRRVAHLKRELERHDGSIASLTNKLKRLKAERAQTLQVGISKQHHPEKSAAAAVEPPKPAEETIVQDGEAEIDKRNELETGVSNGGAADAAAAAVPTLDNDGTAEETKKTEDSADGNFAAKVIENIEAVKVADDGTADVDATDTADKYVSEAAEMDVDTEDQPEAPDQVEVETGVDTAKSVEGIDQQVVVEGDDDINRKVGSMVSTSEREISVSNAEDGAANDGVCRENEDETGKPAEAMSNRSPAAAPEEKKIAEAVDPGADPGGDAGADPGGDQVADDQVMASDDVSGSEEAVKASDSNFVGSASEGGGATTTAAVVDSGSGMLLAAPPLPVLNNPVSESEAEAGPPPPDDAGAKLGDDRGRLIVEIVAEQPKPRRISQEEKESSASAAQHSSSSDPKPAADLNEKSDESHGGGGGGARQADSIDKAEIGSPGSVNEGSASALEDSRVERSDGGSGLEDSSPTSRRSKKETARILKLQPLLDCLRTISNHKLASFFKQKQESQDDPRYAQVVRRHIDINMIRARLKEGAYSGSVEFFRDLLLVFNNCIVFYPRESTEHNAAVVMRKLVMDEMDKWIQAEAGGKSEKPVSRKRDGKKAATAVVEKPSSKPATAAAAAATTSSTPARQVSLPAATTPSAAAENTASGDNSRSKSASLSPGGGVPSSKGGEDDDTREGEPEVEGGKAKPLKAYGRKNKSAGNGEHKPGKGVTREKPLDAIVKNAAAAAAAVAAAAKEKEKEREREKEKERDRGREREKEKDRAGSSTKDKSSGKERDRDREREASVSKAAGNQDKQAASAKGGSKKGKGAAATSQTAASAQQQSEDAPAVASAPVRGVRNKRSAAGKDGQRPAAKRAKR